MTTHDERNKTPDVDRLATRCCSCTAHTTTKPIRQATARAVVRRARHRTSPRSPQRAAAVREATARDRQRYLGAGLSTG